MLANQALPSAAFVLLRLAGVLSALLVALLLTQTLTANEEDLPGLRVLQPGDNLIGWVDYATTAQDLFEQIPEAVLIYTWDADLSKYRFATRDYQANLNVIDPGMGLVVRIAGAESVEWRQPTVADGEWVTLRPGPNLVAWTGPSGTPIDLAVRSIGESFTEAFYWIPETQAFGIFKPDAKPSGEDPPKLRRGDGLWVFNTVESRWLQPSGDRPLHLLGPPPDHIRWYRSFDKYLDADGLAVIATENVADEALFRVAAIIDDMLVNRPDIRGTLVRRRVHTVVVGKSEQTFDLAPYRRLRGSIELDPWGTGGPRGLGPTDYSRMLLVPEEDVLCDQGGGTTTVHEIAHAIDYALSKGMPRENFSSSLARAYRSGRDSGLWEGTYAAKNTAEFWAEAVVGWKGTAQYLGQPFSNRLHLMNYAPPIAQLIVDTLGDFQVDSSCQTPYAPAEGATQAYAIHGHLTDHRGEPLERAEIWLRNTSNFALDRLARSWPDGGYGLFALPGEYTIRLLIDGCRIFHTSSGFTPDAKAVKSAFSLETDLRMDIQLEEPICTIAASGRLLDANGRAVDAYNVIVHGKPGTSRAFPHSNGRFSVRFPNEGRYSLRFRFQGCEYFYDGVGLVRGPRYDLQFNAGQLADSELELRLPQGACSGTIAGRVLDEDGMPPQRTFIGLYIPSGESARRVVRADGFSFRVDLPSRPLLEIAVPGCRAYFGANGLSLDINEVTPLKLTDEGIEDLEIRIPPDLCGTEANMSE